MANPDSSAPGIPGNGGTTPQETPSVGPLLFLINTGDYQRLGFLGGTQSTIHPDKTLVNLALPGHIARVNDPDFLESLLAELNNNVAAYDGQKQRLPRAAGNQPRLDQIKAAMDEASETLLRPNAQSAVEFFRRGFQLPVGLSLSDFDFPELAKIGPRGDIDPVNIPNLIPNPILLGVYRSSLGQLQEKIVRFIQSLAAANGTLPPPIPPTS